MVSSILFLHENRTEIDFGRILGTGGFCTVSALHDVKLALGESEEASEAKEQVSSENDFFMIIQDREYIANNYIRESDGKHRYAIKKLTPGLYSQGDLQHFVHGVIDLAMEAKYLSILRHPHIIKMRGMANVGYCHKDFFILLDRLNSTMSGQIKTWKKELPSGAFVANKKQKKEELFCERLMVGYDMCSAIAYLHERKIVYRDLVRKSIYVYTGSVSFSF
jgi:serine/threonine protein kinase